MALRAKINSDCVYMSKVYCKICNEKDDQIQKTRIQGRE